MKGLLGSAAQGNTWSCGGGVGGGGEQGGREGFREEVASELSSKGSMNRTWLSERYRDKGVSRQRKHRR